MNMNERPVNSGLTAGKIATGAITLVALVALLVGMIVVRPLPSGVDAAAADSSVIRQSVGQRVSVNYCPARMTLADNTQYGDSAYQTSEGDIASSSRYAAFGSVYSSVLTGLTGDDKGELEDKDPADDAAVHLLAGNADGGAIVQTTQLLDANNGTGVSSATASWASSGDLRGIAASGCVDAGLDHSFLLPATQTGWTQRLVIANATAKATTVNVQAWGTSSSDRLSLAVAGTVSVAANGESTVDLSAAAPGQDALFVTVSSRDTPVSAVVRVVAMNGLNPQGNDYVTASGQADQRIALPGVKGAQGVKALLFGRSDASVTLSWITPTGLATAQETRIDANKVQSVDAGAPPADAIGLAVTADQAVNASLVVTMNGDGGQSDFAVVPGIARAVSSAVAVPDQVDATVNLVNWNREASSVKVSAFDADGKLLGTKQVDLTANGAASLSAEDLGQGVAAIKVDDEGQSVSWNVTLGRKDLADRKVGAIAALGPRALTPLRATIGADPALGVIG